MDEGLLHRGPCWDKLQYLSKEDLQWNCDVLGYKSIEDMKQELSKPKYYHCYLCKDLSEKQDRAISVEQFDKITEEINKQNKICFPKETHKGNGVPKGAFAFTLTQSPKDELTQDDMIAAVRKIMSQKSCPVKKYAWYLEKAGESHYHIHGMYETFTEGRIEKKHFKRAWPIWGEDKKNKLGAGFRGGYHRPVRAEEAYSEYISKDGGLSECSIPT